MGVLIRRRLTQLVLVVLAVTSATFIMLEAIPGDPCRQRIGPTATPAAIELCHEELSLDEPLPVRYANWAGGILQGDFGESYSNGIPVRTTLAQVAPVTIQLVLYSLVLSLFIAIPLGVLAAYREGGRTDRGLMMSSYAMLSVPSFVLGVVLILLFSVRWQIFPSVGVVPLSENPPEHFRSMVLPVITLAVADVAIYIRTLRTEMSATLREDFITVAKSRGLSDRRVLWNHGLRASSLGLLTFVGLNVGRLIAGAVVVERIFGINGIGNYLVNSVIQRDYLVLQTLVAILAVAFVLVNLAVDLLYAVVDPRIKPGKQT